MFSNRGIEWGVWLDLSTWTAEQIAERHEKLKEAIAGILPIHINDTTNYREGMSSREQTLLLQAIMEMKDPAKRLEIVEILLDKGADPDKEGFYHQAVYPMEEAKNTKDPQLVKLLEKAKEKKAKIDK